MSSEEARTKSVQSLPTHRQERLAKILDDYLIAAERGIPLSPEEVLTQNPDDADYLREYLSGLKLFHDAAGGLQNLVPDGNHTLVCQAPGQIIGDYRLIREVGRGGMGVVYEAEQVSLRRRVALKVLPNVAANNEKKLQRFRTESLAAASIEHPNIVPVHAIGEENGVHFYAMQFIEGRSLSLLLDEQTGRSVEQGGTTTVPVGSPTTLGRGVLSGEHMPNARPLAVPATPLVHRDIRKHIRWVAGLGVQAANALHAAHEYGVLHRDVKPSNLLVDENGKLWITDFGLARCREASGLTQSGDILGTLRYMSPEQAAGKRGLVDQRTDVFSLGLTLYEAATLQHPFGDDELASFRRDRLHIKPLRSWDRRIPADFETIVMKAIGTLPEERYATASDFADDLERFLSDEPIHARKPGLVTRAGKWAKRHRLAVVSAASAILVAFVALSSALVLVAREKAKTEEHLVTAESHLQDTRDVLDRFGSRLAEQLAAIPGAEGVRLQLLEESLDYYLKFAQQAAGDPALEADVALAYSKIGELTARTGNREEAIGYHRQAKENLKRLLDKDANNVELARNLAVSFNNIGNLLYEMGQEQEALAACLEAIDIQTRLLDRRPESVQLLADLAASYTNLGLVHRGQEATAEAAVEFSRAVSLQQQVVDASDDEDSLRQLALGYSNLASIHEANDPSAASRYYGQAIDLLKSLVEGQPLNLVYQSDLARTYNNVGYLEARSKNWHQAETDYLDAIRIQEHLVASAPAVAAYRRDLAISQNNLGMTLTQLGEYDRAESLFRAAGRLQQQLLAVTPTDFQALKCLGGITNNIGILLQKQGRYAAACKAFDQAVRHQAQALEQSPDNLRVRGLLSNHLYNYAGCCQRLGNTEKAISVALRRRGLWQNDPEQLLGVVKELLSFHSKDTLTTPQDAKLIEASTETLQMAVLRGLPRARLQDDSLAALRATPLFQSLLLDASPHALSGGEHVSGVN